jgi:dTDP-4-amino-4,6-dideoxygalactose transaminase
MSVHPLGSAHDPAVEPIPLVRPRVADPARLSAELDLIIRSGVLTNGPTVRRLEDTAASYLGVRHVVAVSSCTSGLMLVLRCVELTGDVVLPSFTFAATAHAVSWNGLRPVFADVDPATLTLSPASVEASLGARTTAILGTHIYGTPCDVEGLQALVDANGIRLLFDAAHAFGSEVRGVRVGGFGDAEVFSLSPTKVVVAGEGGLISTNDDLLAERLKIARDYGNPGDYDCLFVGLNARLSELHAAVALASLEDLDERLAERRVIAGRYLDALRDVPGISFPAVRDGDRSTFKDLTILVDPEGFGIHADDLAASLASRGIETRRYYSPPVHRMRAYGYLTGQVADLPQTDRAADRALTLPLWAGMGEREVGRVATAIQGTRR